MELWTAGIDAFKTISYIRIIDELLVKTMGKRLKNSLTLHYRLTAGSFTPRSQPVSMAEYHL